MIPLRVSFIGASQMSQDTTVTFVDKPFDPDRFAFEAKHIVLSSKGDIELITRRMKLLITRAYDIGVMEGKKDTDWYEKSMEERLQP